MRIVLLGIVILAISTLLTYAVDRAKKLKIKKGSWEDL